MSNTKNEVLESINLFERLAEESSDVTVVRGAYKLIRQIEELAQLMPEGRGNTSASAGIDEATGAIRKGKPGRKPGRKKGSTGKKSGEEKQTTGKRRGRKPKNAEISTEPTNTAE